MKEELLIKFLNGTCSAEESKQVLDWLSNEESKSEFDAILEKHWQSTVDFDDRESYERLLANIHLQISGKKKRGIGSFFVPFVRVAATFLLLVFSAYILLQTYWGSGVSDDQADLISTVLIERSTGIGEKLTIKMVEGSIITLNAESTIWFEPGFGKLHRKLNLSGEAFFDVAVDSLLPFEVLSNRVTTRALGTAFNIFARQNEIRVSLTSGVVKVGDNENEVILNPGEEAVKEAGVSPSALSVGSFDPHIVTGWKEGKLVYEINTSLGIILSDLERWYGVKMQVDPRVDLDRSVYGTFSNHSLKDILEGLGFSLGFDFKIKEEIVEIKSKSL